MDALSNKGNSIGTNNLVMRFTLFMVAQSFKSVFLIYPPYLEKGRGGRLRFPADGSVIIASTLLENHVRKFGNSSNISHFFT